jgi:hypothetical protein
MKVTLIILCLCCLINGGIGSRAPRPSTRIHAVHTVAQPRAVIGQLSPQPDPITFSLRTTALVTDTEASIIFRVVARSCPDQSVLGSPVIDITPPRYHFSCAVSAGHSIAGDIERFLTPVDAHVAFELARGDAALETFHSYPAYAWDKPLTRPLTERGQSYQAGKWVIRATAVDDTPYGAPLASEDLYQAAVHYCLLPGQICTQYLPLIRNH